MVVKALRSCLICWKCFSSLSRFGNLVAFMQNYHRTYVKALLCLLKLKQYFHCISNLELLKNEKEEIRHIVSALRSLKFLFGQINHMNIIQSEYLFRYFLNMCTLILKFK